MDLFICTYKHILVGMHVYVYIRMHAYECIYACSYIYRCMHTCMFAFVHTYMQLCIHTHCSTHRMGDSSLAFATSVGGFDPPLRKAFFATCNITCDASQRKLVCVTCSTMYYMAWFTWTTCCIYVQHIIVIYNDECQHGLYDSTVQAWCHLTWDGFADSIVLSYAIAYCIGLQQYDVEVKAQLTVLMFHVAYWYAVPCMRCIAYNVLQGGQMEFQLTGCSLLC